MAFTLYERQTRPALHRCMDLPIVVKTVGHYIVPDKNYDSGVIRADTNRIFWICNGTGVMRCGNRVLPFSTGQIAFYEPFAEFYIEARHGPLEYYWTSMLGKLITPIAQSFGINASGLYESRSIPKKLITDIKRRFDDTDAASLRQSSALSYQLLSFMHSAADTPSDHHICNQAMALMRQHWNDPDFSVSSCATQVGLHRSSLNRHFQEHIGTSPGQYLIHLRLQQAVQRLKETQDSIADIANAVGYTDPHYFSRHFRKAIGCTPGTFRRQNIGVPWE